MEPLSNAIDEAIIALVICGLAGAVAYALFVPEEGVRRRLAQAIGAILAAVFLAEPLAAYLVQTTGADPERALIASSFGLGMLAPLIIKAVQKRLGLE